MSLVASFSKRHSWYIYLRMQKRERTLFAELRNSIRRSRYINDNLVIRVPSFVLGFS